VLRDDGLLLLQHGGEQLHLAVRDPAQPLAVDGDRGQHAVQAVGVRQVPQPAAGNLVQDLRADRVDQGPDSRLAGRDDLPAQRVRPAAQRPQDLLGQVSGLVADLPERPRPGQSARRRDREHEY
jgi:hypothetical protein